MPGKLKSHLFKRKYREFLNNTLSLLILILVSVAFLISDFRYGAYTFADFIFMGVLLILTLTLNININKIQAYWLGWFVLIVLLNSIIHIEYTTEISSSILFSQSIKIIFYACLMVLIYNFIKINKLEKMFLSINCIVAVISIIIGIYITVALYSDGRLPHEFFWEFTRTHPTSYEFQGNPNIIRTRSLFSEPAHFGYYLLVILSANLFSKIRIRNYFILNSVIILGVLTTLSYSMIFSLIVLLIMYGFVNFKERKITWNKYMYIFPFIAVILGIVFWDFISLTLLDRTVRILTGRDPSTTNRIIESWQYIPTENLLAGNGIGHTPVITNNFAYILSDFGLLGFIPALAFTAILFYLNWPFAVIVVLLNIFRGGYLAAPFWIVLLFFFLYSFKENGRERIDRR